MTSSSPSSYRPASLAPGFLAASCLKTRLMAWAPWIGTIDTPSASRSRPDRRAAKLKASSSVTPSTRTIVRTAEYCPSSTLGVLTRRPAARGLALPKQSDQAWRTRRLARLARWGAEELLHGPHRGAERTRGQLAPQARAPAPLERRLKAHFVLGARQDEDELVVRVPLGRRVTDQLKVQRELVARCYEEVEEAVRRPDVEMDAVMAREQAVGARLRLGSLHAIDVQRPVEVVGAAVRLGPGPMLVEEMLICRQRAVLVERQPAVGQRHVQHAPGLEHPLELLESVDRVLQVLEQVVGDHEVQRLVGEGSEVFGAGDHRDRRKRVPVELWGVLAQPRLVFPVHVGHPGVRGDLERVVKGADLDPVAAEPPGQTCALFSHHAAHKIAAGRSGARLAEVHELPERVIDVALDQLLALEALDAQLTGEPQVGAVESDEPGRCPLGPVKVVDELVGGEVGVPGERDDVPLLAIGVRVAGHVADGLAG